MAVAASLAFPRSSRAILVSEGSEGYAHSSGDEFHTRLRRERHQQATALIPDEVLQAITFEDLFDYRRKTEDAYAAWSTESNRLALRICDMDPAAVSRELPAIIHGEFKPRMLDYRNETMRDRMFGQLVRKVTIWNVPSLSLAYLSGLSVPAAIALFAGTLVPAVPTIVDYYVERRALQRKNSAAYLVGLAPGGGE